VANLVCRTTKLDSLALLDNGPNKDTHKILSTTDGFNTFIAVFYSNKPPDDILTRYPKIFIF
jgi:hypothetical protein